MIEKLRSIRGGLSVKVKTVIHEVFSLSPINSTKFEEVSKWKKLPAVKECYKNIFKPIDEKDPETTYMSCIIDKVWGESCDVPNVHVAWAIAITQIILNPNNCYVKITEDIIKEKCEENLVSILFNNIFSLNFHY